MHLLGNILGGYATILLLSKVLPSHFGIHQWTLLMVISYFPHSLYIYYLEFFCRKDFLSSFIHLFSHLFISLWAHG